jgi:hypothetical protein
VQHRRLRLQRIGRGAREIERRRRRGAPQGCRQCRGPGSVGAAIESGSTDRDTGTRDRGWLHRDELQQREHRKVGRGARRRLEDCLGQQLFVVGGRRQAFELLREQHLKATERITRDCRGRRIGRGRCR